MKYFNANKPMQRFKDWQADCMARERGIERLRREPVYDKATMRAMCAAATVSHVTKCEDGAAYGARIPVKGGVHSGGVFITGEKARGRGMVFVTVGGSRLIKG
jgi:hypothetical protein